MNFKRNSSNEFLKFIFLFLVALMTINKRYSISKLDNNLVWIKDDTVNDDQLWKNFFG